MGGHSRPCPECHTDRTTFPAGPHYRVIIQHYVHGARCPGSGAKVRTQAATPCMLCGASREPRAVHRVILGQRWLVCRACGRIPLEDARRLAAAAVAASGAPTRRSASA